MADAVGGHRQGISGTMRLDPDLWYVIDLDTRLVDTEKGFACFHDAIQFGNHRGYERHTAMRGKYIMADDRWIINGPNNAD